MKKTGEVVGKVARVTAAATVATTAAVAALGKQVLDVGSNFESSFAKVVTIMDQSQKSVADMRSEILALSEATGEEAATISETVYNAISATGDTAHAVELVGSANKLAKAGFTDTNSALSVLTTAMNAYNLSAEQTMRISDSLITVQNLGVTTIAELSSSMGKAIATASAYGVDLGNLEASYVSLTKSGINTAESTTYVSSMFKELGDSGSAVSKALKDQTGKTFGELLASGASVGDVLGELYTAVNEDSTALMNLWGSAEAGKAANAIINQGLDTFNSNLQAITQSAGATEAAYATMSDTLEHQTELMKNSARNLGIEIYQGLEEPMKNLAGEAAGWMTQITEGFKKGGVDGAAQVAADLLPRVTELAVGLAEKSMAALSKFLPSAVSKLMGALPAVLKGATTIMPQLTTALFELAGNAVRDLVGMLPELRPILLQGFSDLFLSVVGGVDSIFTGLFEGIAQALHQGKTEIMGVWVDSENLGKYDFTADVSAESAVSAIDQAYADVLAALQKSPLTDSQKAEILGMIGEDYDAVKGKLMSFGVSEEEAGQIASAIAGVGETLTQKYNELNIGIPGETIAKWTAQANGSRIVLKGILKEQGLSDSDIAQVLAVFDGNALALGNGTPDLFSRIYDKLTDGLPDTQGDTDAFVSEIDEYYGGMLSKIDENLEADIAALDPSDPEYTAKVTALTTAAEEAKTNVESLKEAATNYVISMSGKSTAAVQESQEQVAELERQTAALAASLERVNEAASEAGEIAFNVVRSGAKADETTISQAVQFKVTEFKLDTQSAEDAYNAAIDELNRQLASKEISQEEYNRGVEGAQADLNAAKEAARAAYENALAEIFSGIAEAEGNQEALNRAMEAQNAKLSIEDFINNMFTPDGSIDTSKLSGISEQLSGVLGEAFDPSMLEKYAADGNTEGLQSYLLSAVEKLNVSSESDMQTALGGKLGEVYAKALEEGVLTGTSFDTSVASEQLSAMFAALAQGGVTGASGDLSAAGTEAANIVTDAEAEAGADGAQAAGESIPTGTAVGIGTRVHVAVHAAQAMARAVVNSIRRVFNSHSPSKVAIGLGGDFGDGMSIGLRESMARAVRVAKRMSGEIATAAEISGSIRVANMPDLKQEISVANENSRTPVYLDGVQIAEIQGHNNSAELAWRNTRASRGVGGR